jgi:hypothetical protein
MIPSNSTGRATYGVGFGRVLAWIVGSNLTWRMDISLLSCVLSGRELCVGCSLVQVCPTERSVSECDRET